MIGVTSNIFTCLKKNNIVLGFSVWSVGHLRFWHKKKKKVIFYSESLNGLTVESFFFHFKKDGHDMQAIGLLLTLTRSKHCLLLWKI